MSVIVSLPFVFQNCARYSQTLILSSKFENLSYSLKFHLNFDWGHKEFLGYFSFCVSVCGKKIPFQSYVCQPQTWLSLHLLSSSVKYLIELKIVLHEILYVLCQISFQIFYRFIAIVQGIIFPNTLSSWLFLLQRNVVDFLLVVLVLSKFDKLPYSNKVLYANIGYFVSFLPILLPIIPFSCLIMLDRTSNTILKNR